VPLRTALSPLVILALVSLGCLRREIRTVQLRPTAPVGLTHLPGADSIGVWVLVHDQRPLYERTSVQNLNKVANDTNPLGESKDPTFVSDRSLESVFREALVASLLASGFRQGREGDPTLSVTLTHYYGEIRHYIFGRDRVEGGLDMTGVLKDVSGRTRCMVPVRAQVVWKPIKDDNLAVQAAMSRLIESGAAALLQDPAFQTSLLINSADPLPAPAMQHP
jgi:uncharacterized lipoprotein YajG